MLYGDGSQHTGINNLAKWSNPNLSEWPTETDKLLKERISLRQSASESKVSKILCSKNNWMFLMIELLVQLSLLVGQFLNILMVSA